MHFYWRSDGDHQCGEADVDQYECAGDFDDLEQAGWSWAGHRIGFFLGSDRDCSLFGHLKLRCRNLFGNRTVLDETGLELSRTITRVRGISWLTTAKKRRNCNKISNTQILNYIFLSFDFQFPLSRFRE